MFSQQAIYYLPPADALHVVMSLAPWSTSDGTFDLLGSLQSPEYGLLISS